MLTIYTCSFPLDTCADAMDRTPHKPTAAFLREDGPARRGTTPDGRGPRRTVSGLVDEPTEQRETERKEHIELSILRNERKKHRDEHNDLGEGL